MKSNRIKISLPTIETRDEAESLVNDIAMITLNKIRTTARMDAELAEVRKRYEGNLTAIDQELDTKTDTLRSWAEAHPEEFPKGRRSIKFALGTLGFHTGNPTVALLNKSWSWKKALAEIIRWDLDKQGWVRSKPEIDKDFILKRNREAKDPAEHAEKVLKPVGLKIKQDQSFFVEPEITEVETRQATEAA